MKVINESYYNAWDDFLDDIIYFCNRTDDKTSKSDEDKYTRYIGNISHSDNETGRIVGLIVGVVAVIGMIISVICCCKKGKCKNTYNNDNNSSYYGGAYNIYNNQGNNYGVNNDYNTGNYNLFNWSFAWNFIYGKSFYFRDRIIFNLNIKKYYKFIFS